MKSKEDKFDKFADSYKSILDSQHYFFDPNTHYIQEYKVAISKDIFPNPQSILDFGCGVGLLETYLTQYYPNSTVYATDISNESLNRVSESYPLVRTVKTDLIHLYRYDLIIVSCVLHHIAPPKRNAVIRELSSLLRTNGILLIFEHNPFNPVTQYLVNTCPFDDDAVLLRRREIKNLITSDRSLHIESSRYTLFFPHFLKFFRRYEKNLKSIPLGGQYYIAARKTKAEQAVKCERLKKN